MQDEGQRGLLSVIIAAYNRPGYLAQTLASVEASTYRPLEVVIVDDGSTDEAPEVARAWCARCAGRDRLTTQFFRQANAGGRTSRNVGFSMSSGEFIQFLDADDLVALEKARIQIDVLERHPDCDYVWSGWSSGTDDDQMQDRLAVLNRIPFEPSASQVVTDMPNGVLFGIYRRRACARMSGFSGKHVLAQDLEYALRFQCLEPGIRQLPNELSVYRVNAKGSMSPKLRQPAGIRCKLEIGRDIQPLLPRAGTPFGDGVRRHLAQVYYGCLVWAVRLEPSADRTATCREAIRGLRATLGPWCRDSLRWKAMAMIWLYHCGGSGATATGHRLFERGKAFLERQDRC
jgi:hypothetical protein